MVRFYNNLQNREDCQTTRKSYKPEVLVGWVVVGRSPRTPKQPHIHFPEYLSVCVLAVSISAKTQKGSSHSDLPKLPQPSGPFGVGRVVFDWIDPNLAADMSEDRGPHRELMVYVWYPTGFFGVPASASFYRSATKGRNDQ
jgi:hypothetical protein